MTVSTATISDCGRYRYDLTRRWADLPGYVLWIMLNPSTADAEVDDPTIRRCIGFSKLWGAPALTVVNLFAYRATDPAALLAVPRDEVGGPDNTATIERHLATANTVVCAWGAGVEQLARSGRPRPDIYTMALSAGADRHRLCCLGMTKGHHPRHPLYVPAVTLPEPWPPSVGRCE